jgi:hypothetical protein
MPVRLASSLKTSAILLGNDDLLMHKLVDYLRSFKCDVENAAIAHSCPRVSGDEFEFFESSHRTAAVLLEHCELFPARQVASKPITRRVGQKPGQQTRAYEPGYWIL